MAIVLLLQTYGQRTAGQLAEALETSERTIRRDLEALSGAGVPVYAQRGRGGGWALLGGHRIDLSGLTASEARSLVLAAVGVPGQPDVGLALQKVLAALPSELREQVMATLAKVHVDHSGWRQPRDAGLSERGSGTDETILGGLRRAIEEGLQIDLCYSRPGQDPSWRRVHPHGLVVKRGVWYLVATTPSGLRTYRVSRVKAVKLTDDLAMTPTGFDLATIWETTLRNFASLWPPAEVSVEILVEPTTWPRFVGRLSAWWDLLDLGVDSSGRRRAIATMPDAVCAARELVGFGDSVEVVSPSEVRTELAVLGRYLIGRYATEAAFSDGPSHLVKDTRELATERQLDRSSCPSVTNTRPTAKIPRWGK